MHFKKEIFDKHMDKKNFQQHMHVWTWDCHANNGISAWKHKMFTRIFSYPVLYWNVSEWCFNFWTFCSTRWFGTKLFWNPDGNIKYTLRHSFLHPLRNWYFVTKIVLTYCEKKLFQWSGIFFEIWGWRPRIFKHFEITRTICSNSERSEQFLVTECFF